MSDEKITYSVHNYDPVNKYIDEKSRIKNAKSVWAYTKSLTLFLLALGLFTLLIAYAYHIFKDNRFYNLVEEGKEVNKSIDGEKVVYSQSVSRFDHSPPPARVPSRCCTPNPLRITPNRPNRRICTPFPAY